jgi:adenosine/AMP kinase
MNSDWGRTKNPADNKGRGVLGVIDGSSLKGVETESHVKARV